MRTISLGLILAVGLTSVAQAQAPAPVTTAPAAPPASPAAPPPATTTAPPAAGSTTTAAPPAVTAPGAAVPGAPATTPPATTPDATPPAPVAEAAPALPTTGDGAMLIQVLEKVCVPLVRGGNFDQLAGQLPGARKNRRDGTWSVPLGGSRDYTINLLAQGVNKDVCQAEVHYAIGGDTDIYKAVNVWAFLHKPELIATANYVQTGGDNVKRVQRSWEHLESASSTAVNFTTWKKPDDTPLNRGYDTGYLFYQERALS
ncbi:MAG: hypothetical protein E7812_12715 [Phenylobacterium sp.]|nr:MAG: hypothetical protein E7812_12715 [Phenylobacterium sp.]